MSERKMGDNTKNHLVGHHIKFTQNEGLCLESSPGPLICLCGQGRDNTAPAVQPLRADDKLNVTYLC